MLEVLNSIWQVVAQVSDTATSAAAGVLDAAGAASGAATSGMDAAGAAMQAPAAPGVEGLGELVPNDGAAMVPPPAVVPPAGQEMSSTADLVAQKGMLHFIEQSDLIGKSLFVILVLMSLTSWYLIFVKWLTNVRTRLRTRRFQREFWAASSLEEVENELVTHGASEPFSHLSSHAIHARNHHAKYGASRLEEKGSTSAFVTRTMRKVIDEETAKLENGLTVLASVGSTAPFVGLFGTVWGVYHALIGIGMSEDGVTINRIAGPVGEALIMTGLGLAVAIPAVLAYNGFVRSNRVYLASLDAFAHDLFTLLTTGQQVENGQPRGRAARTRRAEPALVREV